MKALSWGLLTLAVAVLVPGSAWAQGGPASDARKAAIKALSERIDTLLEAKQKEAGIHPAPLAGDANYFRRVNLDLVGRIPALTAAFNGVRDYLDDFNGLYAWGWFAQKQDIFDKRYKWVDELLESKDFARHWAAVLRNIMIVGNDNVQAQGLLPSFEEYLETRLQQNTTYDKMVREIVTASPFNFNPGQRGGGGSPGAFYFANENKPENLAGATSRIFLGVKLECAQCHAHPFAKWTKQQFWEYAAFFSNINPNQQFRQRGGREPAVNFNGREIAIPGTNKTAKARFLNGAEPQWKNGEDSRIVLANWITAPDNPFFARAAVDIVWSYLFGNSLLEPISEPSDEHPVTHPELLDVLAKEFIASKYDLKVLIGAIVHTEAYRRSSAAHNKMHKDDYYYYARMPVRGLSPEQLFDSLDEATRHHADHRQDPRIANYNQFNGGPVPMRVQFINKFASIEKRTDSQTSILQALFMMNGNYLAERTKNNKTIQDIVNSPAAPAKRIESLYYLVLSRPPRPAELQRMLEYVNAREPAQGLSDICWALLNSAEFMLNH